MIAAYPYQRFTDFANKSYSWLGNAAAAFKAADGDYNVACAARAIARSVSGSGSGRKAFLYS